MIRTVNNSKILDFNCCFSSTHDRINQLWLKFIVLVLQSDWPVFLFINKISDPGNSRCTVTNTVVLVIVL